MFGLGPFRVTSPLSGGLLWKTPWRLSKFQKRRHRLRLRAVDSVIATVDTALARKGETLEALERWKAEMPTEAEMLPKDKYTIFDRKAKRYRKGIHSTFFATGRSHRDAMRSLTNHSLQSCRSGREYHRDSTRRVTRPMVRSRHGLLKTRQTISWSDIGGNLWLMYITHLWGTGSRRHFEDPI